MTDIELMAEAYEWQKHIKNLVTATDDKLYHKRSKVFDWLIEQAERVQELEELIDKADKHAVRNGKEIMKLTDEKTRLEIENKRYREALEFYADQKTYETNVVDQWEPVTPINNDKGLKARQALGSESDE